MDKNPREKYLEKIEIEKLQQKDKLQKEIDEFNKNCHLEIYLPNKYKCFSQVEIHEITIYSLHVKNCIYIKNLNTGDKVKIFESNCYDIDNCEGMEIKIDERQLAFMSGHINDMIEERIKWIKTYLAAIELISSKDELKI